MVRTIRKSRRDRVRRFTEKAVTGMKILVASKAYVDVAVDDYEQGEGDFVNSWDFDVRGEYTSAEELVRAIHKETYVFSDKLSDYVFLDGNLQTDAFVNADNEEPSKSEIEAWENGEETLYNAHLAIPLSVVMNEHEMTEDEAESFGLTIY